MSWRREIKLLGLFAAVFLGCFFMPVGRERFDGAVAEALGLLREYAHQHVLLCLVPALFIAGGISCFISQASVMKYLGARASRPLAYGVASVSGSILAVCSCTVLPLFAGIWRMGAGLGPATAFLYSGPAINVLAIILTARVLGPELGIARAVGAIAFSIIIGLTMHFIYRREELEKANSQVGAPEPRAARPLWQNAVFFGVMVAILVSANWASPRAGAEAGAYATIYAFRFHVAGGLLLVLAVLLAGWFRRRELGEWTAATWGLAKQILPLLFVGVLVAGFLLGRPGREGVIPSRWVATAVGGNSLGANLFASVAGAMMYFATLTEVPILQGLLGAGMGKGPALALLLAGPALSLPNMLVIRSVMGTQKTLVYVSLVIVMATVSGCLFGLWFG